MSEKEVILQTRVTQKISEIADRIASEQGIKASEYLRNLIISDIDHRNLFTMAIKEDIANGEKPEREAPKQ